jgi:two-component system cell cycle sensor histidine kinase/response regulator CckA
MDQTIIPPNQSNSPERGVTNKVLRALIADDSEDDVFFLLRELRKAGYELVYERVSTAPDMKTALERQTWDIVISDYEMPHFGGFEALKLLKESGHDLPFILVSAVVSEETAVAAMKAGAHDYLMKRKLARLAPAIERELREAQTRLARKAAEAALRQSEEQLRQTQKMEAVGRLAASVSHDFNNILTAILGHSEMLISQLTADDPRRINAEQIEKCAEMAATLTKQLLAYSRKQVIAPCVLELNAAILNIEPILRRFIGKDIEFCTALNPDAGQINADPGQIEQLLINLVVNARDAMPQGGKLTIMTANTSLDEDQIKTFHDLRAGDYVTLAVADTGTGMTDEVKTHLFEPFFTTKPHGKGTGLGLATCFGIVKQSNANIQVHSELGKGTTFTIYFPQVPVPLVNPLQSPCLPTVHGQNKAV